MATRPNNLETVQLAIELLRRIPRTRKVTATELREQLAAAGIKRELRTIQRQLETLCQQYDIECDDRTKPYGYRWRMGAKGLTLPVLNEQESLVLMLAEQQLKNLLPASLMKSMESLFGQARRNLGPDANAKREREWLTKVRVVSTTQPLLPPEIAPEIFEAVTNALYGNCWLSVEYRNAGGKVSTGKVMPLGLAQQGPRLYLVCRYKGYDNERSLALHRIQKAKASTFAFERPKDFDLQQYDDEGGFGMGDGTRVRLSFTIDHDAGRHLLETPLSEDQQMVDHGETYKVTATVVDTVQLQWWLNGFGELVRDVRRRRTE